MGITGTTALEAATTIEGSTNSMKAAWANLVTGIARDDADLSGLMSNFTESLGAAAKNVLPRVETILSGMGTLVEQLGAQLGDQAPAMVESALPSMIEAGKSLLGGVASGISDALPGISTAASEILDTLVSEISGSLPDLVPAAISIVSELTDAAIDNADTLIDAAIEIIKALAEGLVNSIPTLIEKAPVVVSSLVDGIVENVPKLLSAAAEIVGELAVGIIDNLPEIGKAAAEIIGKIVSGIAELMNDISDVGKDIVSGVWKGIKEKADWLKEKVTGFFDGIVTTVKDLLGIHSPSAKFRDEVGQYISLGVAEGISNGSDKAVQAADKLAKDVYARSKEWADRQTKYMDLSFDEQLELWETIQGQFIKESKQYAQAEEKIYDLKQKYQAEYFDSLKTKADRSAKYQKATLREQLDNWRDIQDQFIEGSKQYAEAEEKIYDLKAQIQDEYYKKVEDTNKKITDLENAYYDTLAKRQEEIAHAYGLFDAVAEREDVSGQDLLQNLRDQVSIMKAFYSGLDELSDRGVGDALVDEIRAMGPEAEDELHALLGMTDRELSQYANVYMEKQQLANRVALEELRNFKDETIGQMADNLKSLQDYYAANAPDVGLSFTDGLVDGMLSGMSSVRAAAYDLAQAAVQSANGLMNYDFTAPYADIADTMVRSGSAGGQAQVNENLLQAARDLVNGAARLGAGASPTDLTNAIQSGLNGTGVFLDGRKVGRLVTAHQENERRAYDK